VLLAVLFLVQRRKLFQMINFRRICFLVLLSTAFNRSLSFAKLSRVNTDIVVTSSICFVVPWIDSEVTAAEKPLVNMRDAALQTASLRGLSTEKKNASVLTEGVQKQILSVTLALFLFVSLSFSPSFSLSL
jgi:hydrogenase-4 membrane subunit HyfE